MFYSAVHQLLEEQNVRGSSTGRDLKLQSKREKEEGIICVHDHGCVYKLLRVCNCVIGVLHSAVFSSGD